MKGVSTKKHYDAGDLIDAPEHYAYAKAFGVLTFGPWDHRVRSFEDRAREFVRSFPPENPVRNSPGGSLLRRAEDSYAPGSRSSRLNRFGANDWQPGSFHELLARYGLKVKNHPAPPTYAFEPEPSKEAAKRRNIKLRLLHGGVDVEPSDMDVAKAAYLDGQDGKKAAREVRAAVEKMHEELRRDRQKKS